MKILVVCHYFWPEIGAPQARLSEMAAVWAAEGNQVEVLTGFPNHPTGVVPATHELRRRMVEHHDGYRIVRTWLYATPNEGFVRKSLGHLSFMISSLVLGWRAVSRPDVVVVSSPTFFSILPAWLLSKRFRVPFVLEVRDLWPAVFVDLGVLTNPLIIAGLEKLEMAAYRAADMIVVVTDGFRRNLIERGVDQAKVEVITNGVDLEHFVDGHADPAVRSRLGAPEAGTTLVVYIGAHGISHGLAAVVEAIESMDSCVDVHLAMVGEGSARAALIDQTRESDRVTMLPGVPRDEVLDILHAADVLLVPLRNVPLFTTFIPSKMFEFLAAGTPVIGSVAGEAASILEAAGAVVVPPEDPAALRRAIAELASDPERRLAMALRGREHVEAHYDRTKLAQRYLGLLSRLSGGSRS